VVVAAPVEHLSEHPLAAAVVRAARDRHLQLRPVEDFIARPGQGVTGFRQRPGAILAPG
jgi:cation transport ATPase